VFLEQRIPNVMNFSFHTRRRRLLLVSFYKELRHTDSWRVPACVNGWLHSVTLCVFIVSNSVQLHVTFWISVFRHSIIRCTLFMQ